MTIKSFSILHIPPNGVEVTDGEIVSVRNSAGADGHNAHAIVTGGSIQGLNLQDATAAFVDEGDSIALTGTDGTRPFGTITAKVATGVLGSATLPSGSTVITTQTGSVTVRDADATSVDCTPVIQPQTGLLSYVSVPGTAALVTNGMSAKVAGYGGSGPLDGLVAISGGFINWVSLAHPTDTLVSNGFSVDLGAFSVSGVNDYATLNIAAGAITNISVALEPTKTVVSNGVDLTVPVTGTYVTKATPTVAGGVITGIVLS